MNWLHSHSRYVLVQERSAEGTGTFVKLAKRPPKRVHVQHPNGAVCALVSHRFFCLKTTTKPLHVSLRIKTQGLLTVALN